MKAPEKAQPTPSQVFTAATEMMHLANERIRLSKLEAQQKLEFLLTSAIALADISHSEKIGLVSDAQVFAKSYFNGHYRNARTGVCYITTEPDYNSLARALIAVEKVQC